jgi:hypothetical protein
VLANVFCANWYQYGGVFSAAADIFCVLPHTMPRYNFGDPPCAAQPNHVDLNHRSGIPGRRFPALLVAREFVPAVLLFVPNLYRPHYVNLKAVGDSVAGGFFAALFRRIQCLERFPCPSGIHNPNWHPMQDRNWPDTGVPQ